MGDYPVLSGWTEVITRVLIKRRQNGQNQKI